MANTKTVKFVSKFKNHTLVVVPTRLVIQDGMSYSKPGNKIQFVDHEYMTSDKKEIDFLRNHKLFGSQIFENKDDNSEDNAGE